MKKSSLSLILFLTFWIQVSNCLALEHVTHFMQETSKEFEECSWWVKAPLLIVGAYAVTKCCDSFLSRLFPKKVAPQQEILALNQELSAVKLEVSNLKKLNPEKLSMTSLELRIKALEKLQRAKRALALTKLERLEHLEKDMKLVHYELIGIHELLRANIHPIFDKKKKRGSLEAPISPRWLQEEELSLKRHPKKRKGKEKIICTSDGSSISQLDHVYRDNGGGTPRSDFISHKDDVKGEKGN